MERYLGPMAPYLYAILRIVAGLMFMLHGTQKIFGWPGDRDPVAPGTLIGIAGLIELAAGLLIALGLFASVAAFIAAGQMAVAYFMAHFPRGFWPVVNEGELAVLYCFLFLYVATAGAGVWSLDAAMGRGRAKPHPAGPEQA